ncbi:hypothetical protein IIC65_09030, partial [Candidatus Sumerlaeota bacterium]|nr:hypothetical protein [Candidatus Sumerlaeota bacterium]
VANSNVYQESVLLPWQDLNHLLDELNTSGRVVHRHRAVGDKGEG